MSKAFTRESDTEPEPSLARSAVLAPGGKHYLTEAGAERLREQLNRLRSVDRPRLAASADDPEAKRELRALDDRVRLLQQLLTLAEIVPPATGSVDSVRFGAKVRVREESGETVTYRIVGAEETEFFENGISFVSPLAQALLRARTGDRVRFQSPSGPREVEVLHVEY